jgi:hypothetical protein
MIAMIEASWRDLDTTIAGLDDAALLEPGVVQAWSIKDLLGHVTAWEHLALQYLECWRRGEPPPERDWDSTDAYNAREAARRTSWTLAQVQDEAADTRRRLHAVLATITAEEWASRVTIRDRERPLGDWIGGALSGDAGPGTHAAEHATQIRAWRAARERAVAP